MTPPTVASRSSSPKGVHLKTTNATGYARGRFPTGVPLSQVTTVDYTWYGTTVAPAVKYFVDADADGKVDGELRGDVNGGQDVWLSPDTQDFPESALPDGYFSNAAPCTVAVPAPGVNDPCVASGNAKHGSWPTGQRGSRPRRGKAPVLHSGGYSLSGNPGDGVLTQVTYGPNQYVFTNTAKTKLNVTAEAKKAKVKKAQRIRFSGKVTPAAPDAKASPRGEEEQQVDRRQDPDPGCGRRVPVHCQGRPAGRDPVSRDGRRDQLHRCGQEQGR